MKKLTSQKWVRQLFRRRALVIILILIQLVFVLYAIISGSQLSQNFSRLLTIVSCKRQVLFHKFWQLFFHNYRHFIFHTF